MLATGNSVIKAIEVLRTQNVPEDRIIFLNLVRLVMRVTQDIPSADSMRSHQIASPEGMKRVCEKFPKLRVITAKIDQGLDERAYIVPGLVSPFDALCLLLASHRVLHRPYDQGDFGDRYY